MHICFYIIKTDYDIILIYFLLNKTRLLKFKNDWKTINLDPEPKNKLIPKTLFFFNFPTVMQPQNVRGHTEELNNSIKCLCLCGYWL